VEPAVNRVIASLDRFIWACAAACAGRLDENHVTQILVRLFAETNS
jgi:hypothetical protein